MLSVTTNSATHCPFLLTFGRLVHYKHRDSTTGGKDDLKWQCIIN